MPRNRAPPPPSSPPPPPPPMPRNRAPPVADPAPSLPLADQLRQIADEARRQVRSATSAVRTATRTAREVAVLGASVYALGSALLDLCPWCKKSLGKVVKPHFCPSCHRDMLLWDQEIEEEWEARWKSIQASNKAERRVKEVELLRKIMEEAQTRPKKSKNRE